MGGIYIKDLIKHSRQLRNALLSDPTRPGYHFAIPEDNGMPGDPNAAFFANGRYHLMYLYNCNEDRFRYGHLSSIDLFHWRAHPDAVMPDELDGGIFSGGAFLDDDGVCYMTYWALPKNEGESGGIRIAKSSDYFYEKWEKFTEFALAANADGRIDIRNDKGELTDIIGCADPSNIWKKDGKYYMQTGNLTIINCFRGDEREEVKRYKGDWVDLFESENLKDWKFVHRFYERAADNSETDESEDDMCPSFLPLPKCKNGGQHSGKYLQLFIAHNKGCQYYIGDYDRENDLFIRNSHGRMSWVDNTFFAPEALIDERGRQIMWAWLLDNRAEDEKNLWSGVYGLPRLLWYNEDGALGLAVADEIKNLRFNKKAFRSARLEKGGRFALELPNPLSCEIDFKLDFNEGKAGIIVRSDKNEEVFASIYYDKTENMLVMDTTKATTDGRPAVEKAPLALQENESLRFSVFIDKSVLEVFVNDRQAITRRVYPCADCTEIRLFSESERAQFSDISTYEIMEANFY